MSDMKTILARCQDIWWSPLPGWAYVTSDGPGRVAGPGLMARKMPGAFNLFYAASRLPPPTWPGFKVHVQGSTNLRMLAYRVAGYEVEGFPINEWAVTHKPQEFEKWLSESDFTEGRSAHAAQEINRMLKALQKALAIQP